MLLNKSILGGAISVCQVDKEFSQLNCICIEPDGTIAAMNKMVIYAAEPVVSSVAATIPFGDKTKLPSRVILSAEGATQLFKAIQPDKLFKGLLEHVSITLGDAGAITCEVRDGQRSHTINLRALRQDFPAWRELFSGLYDEKVSRIVYNRKRMSAAITSLEQACKYDGSFSPIFSLSCSGDRILWRCQNELTGQRVMALFKPSQITEEWPMFNSWESSIIAAPKLIFKRKVVNNGN
jgi:hypothetical protein